MARKKVETPAPSPLVRISILLQELSQEYAKLAQMQEEQKGIEAEYLSFTDAAKLIGMSEGYIRARVADVRSTATPPGSRYQNFALLSRAAWSARSRKHKAA